MRPFQGKVVRWCRILSINSMFEIRPKYGLAGHCSLPARGFHGQPFCSGWHGSFGPGLGLCGREAVGPAWLQEVAQKLVGRRPRGKAWQVFVGPGFCSSLLRPSMTGPPSQNCSSRSESGWKFTKRPHFKSTRKKMNKVTLEFMGGNSRAQLHSNSERMSQPWSETWGFACSRSARVKTPMFSS